MDEEPLIMSGLKKDQILQSINIVFYQFSTDKRVTKIVNDYNVDDFLLKIV